MTHCRQPACLWCCMPQQCCHMTSQPLPSSLGSRTVSLCTPAHTPLSPGVCHEQPTTGMASCCLFACRYRAMLTSSQCKKNNNTKLFWIWIKCKVQCLLDSIAYLGMRLEKVQLAYQYLQIGCLATKLHDSSNYAHCTVIAILVYRTTQIGPPHKALQVSQYTDIQRTISV